ncbi:MAG TPA: aldehyde dehydrogenase family protein, partial [Solirubrobacteraceae bacterium]
MTGLPDRELPPIAGAAPPEPGGPPSRGAGDPAGAAPGDRAGAVEGDWAGAAAGGGAARVAEQAVLDRLPSGLYIGGKWRPATANATLPVEDPSTGEPLIEVADATPRDALAALAAASDAQASWAATAPRERGEILRRAHELLLARVEDLALVMTLEMGKALGESRAEISYAAEFLRWFSEEAVR